MKLTINKVQHIGIPVVNPDVSLPFYERLGFKCLMNAPFHQDNGDGECWMMGNGDIVLELYRLPECELEAIAARSDGHIDHVAFDVDDIDAAFKAVSDLGLVPKEPQPKSLNFWDHGCKYFNITGPCGETLEFCEIVK